MPRKPKCIHHWVLDEVGWGQCRFCSRTKKFDPRYQGWTFGGTVIRSEERVKSPTGNRLVDESSDTT